jgi:hypothetical protein
MGTTIAIHASKAVLTRGRAHDENIGCTIDCRFRERYSIDSMKRHAQLQNARSQSFDRWALSK